MSIGKATGDERGAALLGRVMGRADDSAGSDRNRCITDCDGNDAPGRDGKWHVVRQEVLPRFEAACNCRVWAIDVPPEMLVQRRRAMHQAGRPEVDLFA